MTNGQKETVVNALPGYCKFKGITYGELAVKAGLGYEVIMNMRNHMWAGVDDKHFKRVWLIVNPETMEGTFKTADLVAGLNCIEDAIKYKRMNCILGDTGMGKTWIFKTALIKPNVFYMYIDGTVTPQIFLTELLQEMGLTAYGGPAEMLKKVVGELNVLENPLLIIDEAAKIKDKLMLLIHSIRDKTKENAGIVLGGMPHFKNQMLDKISKGVNGWSEFFRRINRFHELQGLSKDEITHILEQNGITEKGEQMEFRNFKRFGDLDNAINLHKTLNN